MELPESLSGRFNVDRVLDQTPLQSVLQVEDLENDGVHRTLKLRRTLDGGIVESLAAEFRLQHGVRHPHLTAVHEFGRYEEGVWLLREYVDGPSLEQAAADLDEDALVALLAQVLRGLGHLHARGFLHLDLKPQNILLRQTAQGYHALVTDFGFGAAREAREIGGGQHQGRPRPVQGTPPFVAPETLLGLNVDERADLFSFAVTWLTLLADAPQIDLGRLYSRFPREPFLDALDLDPDSLGTGFAALLERLLATDPEDRPRSVADVLRAIDRSSPIDSGEDPADYLGLLRPPSPFRSAERLAALDRFVRGESDGVDGADPVVSWWHLAGPSDAEEVVERCRFVASLENRTFHQLGVTADPERSPELVSLPEQDRMADRIGRVRQELRQGGVVWSRPGVDPESVRLAAAAARFLKDADNPEFGSTRLLIVTDQGLDPEDRAVLEEACGAPISCAGVQLDQVVAHLQRLEGRADQEGTAARSRLERLARALCDTAGDDREALESGLRALVVAGEVGFRSGCFDFASVDPTRLPVPPSREDQVDALDPASCRCIAALDLLGGSQEPVAWRELLTEEETTALSGLLQGRLCSLATDGGDLSVRAGLGRLARSRLDPPMRRELALRILEQTDAAAADPGRLCLLRVLAGDVRGAAEALSTVVPAGLAWLDEAVELCPDQAPELRLLRIRQAEMLVRAGNLTAASVLFDQLLTGPATDLAEEIRLLGHAGRVDLSIGRLGSAEERFRLAVRKQSRPGALADDRLAQELGRGLAFARFLQGDVQGARRTLERLRKLAERHQDEAAAATLILLGAFTFRSGNRSNAEAALAEGLARARSLGDDPLVAMALINQATIQLASGDLDAARAALVEAAEIRSRRDHPIEEAVVLMNLGIVERERGELAEARRLFREASRLRRGLGDPREQAVAESNLASAEAMLGDLRSARERLASAIETLDRLGARVVADLSRCRLAELLIDVRLESEARLLLDQADREEGEEVPRVAAQVGLARSQFALRFETPERALPPVRAAAALFAAAGDRFGASRAAALHARILLEGGDPGGARRKLSEAHAAAAPRALAELLLLDGLVAEQQGAPEEALALLLRARDEARRTDQPLLRARAAALAARVIQTTSPERARAFVGEVQRVLRGIELPAPAAGSATEEPAAIVLGTSLANVLSMDHEHERERSDALRPDRVTTEGISDEVFRTFVAFNRSLLREQDLGRLLERLLEQAVTLTGGHRGFLLLLKEGQVAFESRSGDVDPDSEEISRGIVLETLKNGRPLVTANALSDQRLRGRRSIEELDLRSVICVPFQTEGRAEGAIYIDNPIREGVFSTRSIDLLEALAGQAALAIGHLERRAEIERLNSELTERAERSELELVEAQRRLQHPERRTDAVEPLGESEVMRTVITLGARVAPTDMPVLILGESGTGKELVARFIHARSRRATANFVAENCSAIPETLLESEFFGHRKGAFTGADQDRIGLFVRADQGTLFLDEIGDMPPSLQSKLLRVLQEKLVRPVGSMESVNVDVRLICATHRNLEEMVRDGSFREDLYYRIRGTTLRLPPLRERLEDVPTLARHFLERLNRTHDSQRELSRGLTRALMNHDWPGNVRELQSEITRLYHLASDDELDAADLDLSRAGRASGEEVGDGRAVSQVKPMTEIEQDAILLALEQTGGNREEAARRLAISRAAFYVKLKKYGLSDKVPSSRRRKPS